MLNAFNARSIFELTPKDRFRIDSVLAYGDKLILGLSTGALRVYRVLSPDTPDVSLELLRTVDNFSRRKIEVLACIKEAGILVSLADSNVHIHDLNDFTLTETLGKARGASTLAVTSNVERDAETQIPSIVSKLAIGVRRKLLLYSWADGGFQEGKEVTLSANVKSLTWAGGHRIVVGLASGFVMVDVDTASVEEVVPTETTNGAAKAGDDKAGWGSYIGMGGWGSRSLSTRLAGDELLLVKDSSTLFINIEGKPLDRPPIQWQTPPDSIAYSYPYLVSINSAKQQLEVRNPVTRTLLQTMSLPTVTMLHVPPPNVSLTHAGKLFFVASPMQVWRMGSADYETQINELVEADQLDEAIRLIESLESVLLKESKEEKLRWVQMLKAEKLFHRRRYEESMALFGQVSAPPERVIRLYPPVIAGELSIWPDEEEREGSDQGDEDCQEQEEDEEEQMPTTENVETERNGTNGTNAEDEDSHKANGEADESATPEKGRSVTPELKRSPTMESTYGSMRNIAFTRKYGDTASIFSFGSRRTHQANADAANVQGKEDSQPDNGTPRKLEGDELKRAVQDLIGIFLNDVRRKLTKYYDRDGKPKDPLKILSAGSAHEASKNDPLEASFLVLDEPDVEDPVQGRIDKLMETCRLVDTTLFRAYMLIRPALIGSLVRIQNHCDPDVVSEKLREHGKFDELVDFLERKKLHRDALELLRFFGQAEDDSKAPNLHGPQKTVTYLERLKAEHIDLILEFATWPLQIEPELGMEIFVGDTGNSDTLPRAKVLDYLEQQDQSLAIQYLEHIVTELHDMTPEFHTRLAGLYLSILSRELSPEQKTSWQARFLKFLESSDQYRAEKVLGWLPRNHPEYFECRAVVLSKMGRHKAALEIYVFKLHDHDKAEHYCMKVHRENGDGSSEADTIYHALLSLYLQPPAPYNQQLDPALAILSRHGARLEADEALKLIPENVRVSDLEAYFESRIRAANARVSENRIIAALRKSHLLDVKERLLGARNSHATVAEESVCPVCHKRLGLSVIWRLPTGQVVHYGCARKANF
ncbi:vacuolar sorting protein 39 domain 2-domain-containing protein [Sphaerosporella brunnea]|uniref:Vacuolar sorting protein 39 domain 2-domain-containing protein n=1 Tax=Sphaerosporella brunnea TaxID=1250544 RepID=A0A5J5EI89_9PEZI|nr:vacuolar sorting protein 39 domain 2-domain-containing protein [Sphaerosporella brunnea]